MFRFDATIADGLSQYEYKGDAAGGYNPNRKLWSHQGFNYSVGLYDADGRIAIEVEKSEQKNVSDDLLKFQKGYRTQKGGRPKIEFGCLVAQANYLGRHNLYQHSLTKLDFMKGVLFIDDVVGPTELQISLSDGIGDAESARLDIQWSELRMYSFHYVDSDDVNWRFDRHPNTHSPEIHFHPPPEATTTAAEPSCIDVTEVSLVTRAVHAMWRAAYENDELERLNSASHPP